MARSKVLNMAPAGSDEIHSMSLRAREMAKLHLSRRIKLWLADNDMTASDLARKSGLPRDHISRYILMRTFPTEDSLQKLARGMGLDPSELAPSRAALYVVAENPTVSMSISPDNPGKAWLKIEQLVDRKTAQKIIDMLHADNDSDNRK